jgi:hypothetical protein
VAESFEVLSFYRGVSAKVPLDRPSIHAVRRDRRPRDSNYSFHTIADEWFLSRFGVRYRSGALFVVSNLMHAGNYAETPLHVMRIIPLDAYTYCWSPVYRDLLFIQARLVDTKPKSVFDALDLGMYRESDLHSASVSGHEVMLYCEKYLAVPISLLDIKVRSNESIIVTPANW